MRRLRGDWWELNEQATMLVGTRNGGALRLGDPVAVRVGRIDAPRGRVDLRARDSRKIDGLMAKGRKRKAAPGDVATNRQASYRYNLLERFECGIVLTGTEVKSLREGKAQLKDSYADVRDGEVWLIGVYIPPYGPASRDNHDPERPRKLLLHRREIERLIGRTHERGLTLVPTRIYFAGPALARQGRDRAGAGQGPVRQARVDPQARHGPRGAARAARGWPLGSASGSPGWCGAFSLRGGEKSPHPPAAIAGRRADAPCS